MTTRAQAEAILEAVEWVDEPPPDGRSTGPNKYDWGFLMGLLSQNPGQWAKVDVPHSNLGPTAHYMRENYPVEAVTRGGVLYARWRNTKTKKAG